MIGKEPYNFYLPVELCSYVLTNRLTNQFRLYVYLKGSCAGKRKISKADIKEISKALSCNPKSIQRHVKNLLELKWIGYSSHSQLYFIRGFEDLKEKYNLQRRTASQFQESDLQQFKPFLAGSVIGYITNHYKHKAIKSNRAERYYQQRSNQPGTLSNGFAIACRLISKVMGISEGQAYNLKEMAEKAGYLKIEKQFQELPYKDFEKDQFVKGWPELAGRVRKRKGKLALIQSDKITSLIRFKTQRKRTKREQ
jgi:hypothetical protein